MKNINANHYKQFNYEERLNLTLAAIAREDNEEILQLLHTCPKQHYIAIDSNFRERLLATFIIQTEFDKWITFYQHKLETTRLCIIAFGFLTDHPKLLEEYQPKFKNVNVFDKVNQLIDATQEHQSALKSISLAIVEFCDAVNVDYKNLIALDKFNEKTGDLSHYLNSEAHQDEEIISQMKGLFFKIWEEYVIK